MPTTDPAPARAVLYARRGCHLCDEARTVVAAVAAERGAAWREVDVDDAGLADRYGELVPVVEVDGVRVGYWQIDADRVRDALAAPPTA